MGIDPIDSEFAELIRTKAQKLVGHYGFSRTDVDDIEQQLRLLLIERGTKLLARQASQRAVIETAVRNAIRNLIESRQAKKRKVSRRVDLDEATTTSLLEGDARLESAAERLDVQAALSSLPPNLRRIADILMTESQADAAKSLGITRGCLRQQIQLITEHFVQRGIQK